MRIKGMNANPPFIDEHIDLARKAAAVMSLRIGADRDDLESAAMDGLMRAGRTFDPHAGTRFATYATAVIHNRMVDAGRRESCRKSRLTGLFPNTRIAQNEPVRDARRLVCRCFSVLSLDQKKLLVRHYMRKATLAELARRHGVTTSAIGYRIRRAVEQCQSQVTLDE